MSSTCDINEFLSTNLEDRQRSAENYLKNNPTKVPVLIINHHKSILLNQFKYLLSRELKVGRLVVMLKKMNSCSEEDAIYFYAGNKILRFDQTMQKVYEEHRSEDGFLYIRMTNLPTFGV